MDGFWLTPEQERDQALVLIVLCVTVAPGAVIMLLLWRHTKYAAINMSDTAYYATVLGLSLPVWLVLACVL